jgi:tRNA threonylcarbamoyl adenosine modification protein YeaZ
MAASASAAVTLALDTAAGLSLAMVREDQVLAMCEHRNLTSADARLLVTIERWVSQFGVPDRIVVGTGPGSFTGTRVGVTAAKTLAWAWSRPVWGASSLAADAWQAGEVGQMVVATTELRRDELYLGIYRVEADRLETIVPDRAWQLPQVPDELERAPSVCVTGPLAQHPWLAALALPAAVAVVEHRALGLVRESQCHPPKDAISLEPQYLRPVARPAKGGPQR